MRRGGRMPEKDLLVNGLDLGKLAFAGVKAGLVKEPCVWTFSEIHELSYVTAFYISLFS